METQLSHTYSLIKYLSLIIMGLILALNKIKRVEENQSPYNIVSCCSLSNISAWRNLETTRLNTWVWLQTNQCNDTNWLCGHYFRLRMWPRFPLFSPRFSSFQNPNSCFYLLWVSFITKFYIAISSRYININCVCMNILIYILTNICKYNIYNYKIMK